MSRISPPRWWQRASLRTKTMLVTALPVALILLAVPVLYVVQQDAAHVGDQVERTYRVRESLGLVLQDLVDAETGIRGYVLTQRKAFLEPYDAGLNSLGSDLPELGRRLPEDAQTQARYQTLLGLARDRLDILGRIKAFVEDEPPGAEPTWMLRRGKVVMDQVRAVIDRLETDQAAVLAHERERLHRAQAVVLALSVGAIPFVLIVGSLLLLRFTRRLASGIRRIEENTRRLEHGEPLLEPPNGEDELARLGRALAQTASRLAEQDAELRELALVDELTGLPNRRAFLQIADHELEVAKRTRSANAVLFVDADGLKEVNDRFGHAAGDAMLRELADILRSELRQADLVARLGGDEFVVLLSRDTSVEGDEIIARLQAEADRRNDAGNHPYRLAFSVGTAVFDPASPVGIDDLLRDADAEMYQRKRAKQLARAGASPTARVS
jgi:diguanylate cyclase (GGDEF)-like protein